MARRKGQIRLITKAEIVRTFGLTRDQVNYLFRMFPLQPLSIIGNDRRCKWYRYNDVATLVASAPIKKRAKAA